MSTGFKSIRLAESIENCHSAYQDSWHPIPILATDMVVPHPQRLSWLSILT